MQGRRGIWVQKGRGWRSRAARGKWGARAGMGAGARRSMVHHATLAGLGLAAVHWWARVEPAGLHRDCTLGLCCGRAAALPSID